MMTNTKRMPKPMTSKDLAQYRELHASLIVQSELIMSIFDPNNAENPIIKVEFEMGHPNEPWVNIWHYWISYGEDGKSYFSCPESYFNMTADELKAERARLLEEEKRKKAERAAKAKAARENARQKGKPRRRPRKRTKDTRSILS